MIPDDFYAEDPEAEVLRGFDCGVRVKKSRRIQSRKGGHT